ncbi:Syntaxin-1B [Halotydeus destructor]|nr:Syntaxin-1B [Halotydeus destructor]
MTKDRLADLKRLSQIQNNGSSSAVAGGTSGGDEEAIEMEAISDERSKLMNPFFDEVESIQSAINKLKDQIEKIQKLHSFFLLRPAVDEDCKKELDELNHIIKASAISIKKRLSALKESNDKLEDEGGVQQSNCTELRMRQTQFSFLQKWFVDLMTEHSCSQSDYQTKYKERLKRELNIMGHSTTDDQLDDMLETGNVRVFTEGLLLETENQRKLLSEIETRHHQILDLEKSIRELHDLFLDMALMVEAQGDKVDTIEFQVMRARDATNLARDNLKEARTKQRAAFKKKLWCYAILIVVLVIILASVATELFG